MSFALPFVRIGVTKVAGRGIKTGTAYGGRAQQGLSALQSNAKKQKTQDEENPSSASGMRVGMARSFVFMNGLVLAAVVFVILHFTIGDMKAQDMRRISRDIVRMAEDAVRSNEKAVSTLSHFYATLEQDRLDDGRIAQSVQQLLTEAASLDAILWATDADVWYQEDIQNKTRYQMYRANLGWPGFKDMMTQVQALEYGQIGYLYKAPWPAFAQRVASGEPAVALVVKLRTASGGTGVFMAMATPQKMFANSLRTYMDDLSRITMRDRDTGHVLLDRRMHDESGRLVAFSTERISDTLQMGGKFWDVHLDIRPSRVAKVLSSSPWAGALIVILLTLVWAAYAEKRQRQEQKLAEMSRTLKGAHTELQSRISERDQLFHAMRKSEREYRAVINSVSDVIFETDETGKLVFLNETWKRMTHLEVQETIGRSLFLMLDTQDQMPQKEMFEELVRGERQAYRIETRINPGNDAFKPVEIAFSMLRMAEDKSIRVVGTITDIEKRRRAEQAMREAEQRFRGMFENSISGIYQIAPEGRFISANPALAEILGYRSAEELMTTVKDIGTQIYVRPEDRKSFVDKLLFEGRVSGIETEVKRKDGKRIWIMENARVVRNERGSVVYFEGSIWDVTERKQAEDTMRDARLQAEISSRTRMEFLANMSHELRTPLNAVIGFSEIIKDEVMGPLGTHVYKEYAQDIYDSGNYLLKVISEILEVSKIETGNRELAITTFRLPKALKSCMIIMSTRVDQAGVEVNMNIPDDLPELMAEELGVKQIMLNLIGNAIKFTPEGGKVDVTAHVEQKTGELIIDVIDTGIGMTEDEIKKAMQPFGKVDTTFSGMKAGTGLGLTIVDSLVTLHGGRFQLISEKGRGTTARVIFPAERVLHKKPHNEAADGTHLKVIK